MSSSTSIFNVGSVSSLPGNRSRLGILNSSIDLTGVEDAVGGQSSVIISSLMTMLSSGVLFLSTDCISMSSPGCVVPDDEGGSDNLGLKSESRSSAERSVWLFA